MVTADSFNPALIIMPAFFSLYPWAVSKDITTFSGIFAAKRKVKLAHLCEYVWIDQQLLNLK